MADNGNPRVLLKREGLSMTLVEQNVHLALSLADDVALFNTGRIVVS